MQSYKRANDRADLSSALIHLTRDVFGGPAAPQVLEMIVTQGTVNASLQEQITRYDQQGAACFYDVPYQNWNKLIQTNTNGRRGYGVVVMKPDFWRVGGRPVIYTDNPNNGQWPDNERYRLVWTDLTRKPYPVDWMHEREWRIRGPLKLFAQGRRFIDWWPCVPNPQEAARLLEAFTWLHEVYDLQSETLHTPLSIMSL